LVPRVALDFEWANRLDNVDDEAESVPLKPPQTRPMVSRARTASEGREVAAVTEEALSSELSLDKDATRDLELRRVDEIDLVITRRGMVPGARINDGAAGD